MKKDIIIPEVKNVHIAAILEDFPDGTKGWVVYLVNNKNELIEGVMITSKGYGIKANGEEIKTSVMRHVIGNIPAKTAAKIEPITEEVFGLNNEFWVTFFEGNKLMEKKYIFGPHTITTELEEDVLVMNMRGVVIK